MKGLVGQRILIVDDDEAQREVVEEILGLEGAQVLSAESADRAIEQLPQQPVVLLVDFHGINAERVLDAARNLPSSPRVILISGDLNLAEHAERLGADGYLSKPYDIDELLRCVARALAPGEDGQSAPL